MSGEEEDPSGLHTYPGAGFGHVVGGHLSLPELSEAARGVSGSLTGTWG